MLEFLGFKNALQKLSARIVATEKKGAYLIHEEKTGTLSVLFTTSYQHVDDDKDRLLNLADNAAQKHDIDAAVSQLGGVPVSLPDGRQTRDLGSAMITFSGEGISALLHQVEKDRGAKMARGAKQNVRSIFSTATYALNKKDGSLRIRLSPEDRDKMATGRLREIFTETYKAGAPQIDEDGAAIIVIRDTGKRAAIMSMLGQQNITVGTYDPDAQQQSESDQDATPQQRPVPQILAGLEYRFSKGKLEISLPEDEAERRRIVEHLTKHEESGRPRFIAEETSDEKIVFNRNQKENRQIVRSLRLTGVEASKLETPLEAFARTRERGKHYGVQDTANGVFVHAMDKDPALPLSQIHQELLQALRDEGVQAPAGTLKRKGQQAGIAGFSVTDVNDIQTVKSALRSPALGA